MAFNPDTVPAIGQIMEIPLRTRLIRFAKVVRRAGDVDDHRRCSACGQPFRYGPIGQHCATGKLVCLFDCTK